MGGVVNKTRVYIHVFLYLINRNWIDINSEDFPDDKIDDIKEELMNLLNLEGTPYKSESEQENYH